MPPPNATSVTTRDLWDIPTLSCLSQVVHALHGVTAQSTGHTGAIEQAPSSVVLEHATPPAEAGVSIVRIRWRDPVPHVREHGLHGCHAPWEQSIGHASAAQLSVSERTGHKSPPLSAAVCTERVRLEVPAPQLTAQADHWPHALTAQSTGHDEMPHSASSLVSGQLSPSPTRGRVTLLVRSATPVSQLREHVPHATHSLTEQLTGSVGVAVRLDEGAGVWCGVGAGVGLHKHSVACCANAPYAASQHRATQHACRHWRRDARTHRGKLCGCVVCVCMFVFVCVYVCVCVRV
jgi:hypothetical protein